MGSNYLGRLDFFDPMYEILLSQACPDVKAPLFHVNRMNSGKVYKYTEDKTRTAIVGKFFRMDDRQDKVRRIKGEYDNLQKLRSYGFNTFPNYIVRPISREEKIGLALIEEFIYGKDLDYYFKKAIYSGDGGALKASLSKLAKFLYSLHTRTENGGSVNLDLISEYFRKIVNKLNTQTVISDGERKELLHLMDRWLGRTSLQNSRNVIVHGDATPTNFIFTNNGSVVAIDLERMKECDKAFDVSMICGELKHAFLWRTGDPFRAELFIRHFLKEYASHFDDSKKAFRKISRKNPFYMAMAELRIARNNYLDWNYRKRLVHEAMECLRWGLRIG